MKTLWGAVKNFVVAIFVITISLLLFYFFSNNRQLKQDLLAETLKSVAEKALDMVPDRRDRELLAAEYQSFLDRVRRRRVRPEQVEKIAAQSLNLAYADSVTSGRRSAELRRALILVRNQPAGRVSRPIGGANGRHWQRLERRILAADKVMARLHTGFPHDTALAVAVYLDSTLKPALDSLALARLQFLEEKTRQLEAIRSERLYQLEQQQKLLDSLRQLFPPGRDPTFVPAPSDTAEDQSKTGTFKPE